MRNLKAGLFYGWIHKIWFGFLIIAPVGQKQRQRKKNAVREFDFELAPLCTKQDI